MGKIKNGFLFAWQLPQNILGIILTRALGARETVCRRSCVVYWFYTPKGPFGRFISGVSLGKYIILNTRDEQTVKHEYGHCRQSLVLGWLYLILIGIPSSLGNLWDRAFHKRWPEAKRVKWYYTRAWEAWADRLGGVRRPWR